MISPRALAIVTLLLACLVIPSVTAIPAGPPFSVKTVGPHHLDSFSLPHNSTMYATGGDIANLTGVLYVTRWNRTNSEWEKLYHNSTATNWNLVWGEGYYAYIDEAQAFDWSGAMLMPEASYEIVKGLQYGAQPIPAFMSAWSFCQNQDGVFYISLWNETTHQYMKWYPDATPEGGHGTNFTMSDCSAVWIYASSNGSVSPNYFAGWNPN